MDERTEMIVEVDGVDEVRKIDHIDLPYPLTHWQLGIKQPVLNENEMVVRALPDKVIIIKKWKGYGECEDYDWYHDPDGCNVERDSDICRLNKRQRGVKKKEK